MVTDLFNQAKALAEAKKWTEFKSFLRSGIEAMTPEDRNQILEGDQDRLQDWFILMAQAEVDKSFATELESVKTFFMEVMLKMTESIPD
ncbi:MAG: hypothetical protein HQK60_12465 [Deltaproteobacteria bacterium]|nr:hypothetical protein [Deltaproteobacteria bacterium]